MSCDDQVRIRSRRLPPVSRADLVRLFAEFGPECNIVPELLGYKLELPQLPRDNSEYQSAVVPPPDPPPAVRELPIDPEPDSTPAPAPDSVPTADRQRLKVWRAVAAESFPVEDSEAPTDLLTDDEIHKLDPARKLPLQPLQPWRRLAPFLRRRLGTTRPGGTLDLPRLLRRLLALQPPDRLPRRPVTAWQSGICLLWDEQPEMHPFTPDVRWLHQRWEREVGYGSILVLRKSAFGEWPEVPAGMPVLAVSAMGLQAGDPGVRNSWLAAGRRLLAAGHPLSALVPCSRLSADPALQRTWNAVVWDTGRPLPRHPGPGAVPADTDVDQLLQWTSAEQQAAAQLLNLLAPAPLIEAPLLRQARLAFTAAVPGTRSGVDLEWQVWHHEDCWQSPDWFGPQDAASERLQTRNLLPQDLRARVDELIHRQHTAYSCVRALEARLRMLSSTSDLTHLQQELRRIVHRLQKLAQDPRSHAGRSSGLPSWFRELVRGLSPELRQREGLKELIAEGLALADYWSRDHAPPPAGIDERVHGAALQQAARRHLRNPVVFQAGAAVDGLCFARGERPGAIRRPVVRMPTDRSGNLIVRRQAGGITHSAEKHSCDSSQRLIIPAQAERVELESVFGRVVLESFERPAWADRMWLDQYGLAVQFHVGTVPFVMRWIPPGQFLMGSPESEQGRYLDEGPQHRVTISRGFWMGETPVTQRQWRAVVEAVTAQQSPDFWGRLAARLGLGKDLKDQRPLNPKPSHFADRDEHPVEQVSWRDCVRFCEAFSTLLPEGPRFHLPTEAEWEYACRAGTGSAFSDGSECTRPEGLDPALERLGWCEENSGSETHAVKQKQGNGWGLFDLHGNVWEWCWDGQRSYDDDACKDPIGALNAGALRAVRGGGYRYIAQRCRSAFRDAGAPGDAWLGGGSRLSAGQERAQSGTGTQSSQESS